MEKKTLEDIVQRLDRLEKIIAEEALKNNKQDAHLAKEALDRIFEEMGIPPDFELKPLKEVRKSMVESGIRPEDNEFSRAIIAEREK